MKVKSEPLIALMGCDAVVEGRGVWLACPARIASLARAPFALRKGRGWCWFSGEWVCW